METFDPKGGASPVARYEIRIAGAAGPLVTAHVTGLRSAHLETTVRMGTVGPLPAILLALLEHGVSGCDIRLVPRRTENAAEGSA